MMVFLRVHIFELYLGKLGEIYAIVLEEIIKFSQRGAVFSPLPCPIGLKCNAASTRALSR